jgi:DNA-binding SARP family transcriptional activator
MLVDPGNQGPFGSQMEPNHGNHVFANDPEASTYVKKRATDPVEGRPDLRRKRQQVRESLGVPRDPRGIVLLCGYVVAALFGLTALLTPPGDPIGWVYIVLAAVGYLFIQTRGVTTFLWLLVAAGGALVALGGNLSGWIEFGLGMVLALVGLAPLPSGYGSAAAAHALSLRTQTEPVLLATNGHSSSVLEEARTQTSGLLEEAAPPAGAEHLVIQAIGHLRLVCGERDVAPDLEDKPVLAFLFKYLLARSILGEREVARRALGDELSPGVPESSQKERLRKQLYDLQRSTPPAIGALVRVNRSHVWLDLTQASSDVSTLRHLADRVQESGRLIDAALATEISQALEGSERELLHGFEDLELKVNQGRGTAGETVARARESLAALRGELIHALADHLDAMGRPEAAIRHLRAGLDAMPGNQALARLLVVAYLKTGQTARASEVRRQFSLKEER